MKSRAIIIALIFCAAISAEDIAETIANVAKSVDAAPRTRFLSELTNQRSQMTSAVVAILTTEGNTPFQKAFALEIITRNHLTDALDATLPYVAFVNPSPGDNMSWSGVYLGAKALAAIGAPASDRVIASVTGKEDDQTVNGIAVVVVGIDGKEFGKVKVDALAKAALDQNKPEVQKVLNKVLLAMAKQ